MSNQSKKNLPKFGQQTKPGIAHKTHLSFKKPGEAKMGQSQSSYPSTSMHSQSAGSNQTPIPVSPQQHFNQNQYDQASVAPQTPQQAPYPKQYEEYNQHAYVLPPPPNIYIPPPSQQAPIRRVVGVPVNVENISAQKTGFRNKDISNEAQVLDKAFDAQLDEIKEQIQNYLEVCDTLSHKPLNMEYLVENLFVLIRSLNFDFMIFLLADTDDNKKFSSYYLRGIKIPPPQIPLLIQGCVSEGKIRWNDFIKTISNPNSEFSKWMLSAKVFSVGYVPFHDGESIIGLMILGAYSKKQKTAVASQILELCSGRIGLGLSLYARQNKNKYSKLAELLTEISKSNNQTQEYFDLLSSSISDKEGLAAKILLKCKDSISQTNTKIEELLKIVKGI